MRYAKRTDANHSEIRDGLRKCGYTVADYSRLGGGVPDLCVRVRDGVSLFLEVKVIGEKLTKAEEEWMKYNSAITRTVFSLEGALSAVHQYKQELSCMLKNLG